MLYRKFGKNHLTSLIACIEQFSVFKLWILLFVTFFFKDLQKNSVKINLVKLIQNMQTYIHKTKLKLTILYVKKNGSRDKKTTKNIFIE